MSCVIVVRHAMPEVVRGVSSRQWGLSEASREDCVLLAHALPPGIGRVWSSDERKAKETADVVGLRLGLPVSVDVGFGEVDRPDVWDRDYREVAAGYLGGADEPGWEERAAVVRRFAAAVGRAQGGTTGDVVIVTHGMAMSLWVASVAPVAVVEWWRALTFPDAWRIEIETGMVERGWMGGAR